MAGCPSRSRGRSPGCRSKISQRRGIGDTTFLHSPGDSSQGLGEARASPSEPENRLRWMIIQLGGTWIVSFFDELPETPHFSHSCEVVKTHPSESDSD
jgi:hypothetical protein